MMQVTKVWWDGEKLMAEPIDPAAIYKEPEQPAQQEPVAWWNKTKDTASTDPVNRNNADCQPLYTSPPAQRTWVGLSDLDIDKLENEYMKSAQTAHQFLRAIEAKLRSKNT